MGLSDFFYPQPETDGGKVANDAMRIYSAYKIRHAIADRVLDRFPSIDGELERTDRQLSIRLKKKELGLPYDSDDYEDAVNNDHGFAVRSAGALGRHVTKEIPDPSFLRPSSAPWFNTETSFPKTTSGGAGGGLDMLLSGGLRSGGGRHGRVGSAIARFFGRG